MNVLVVCSNFPSRDEPTRGIFNARRLEALAQMCAVRVVAPVPIWRRLSRPAEWRGAKPERYGSLDVTYPTYWSLPRVGVPLHAAAVASAVTGTLDIAGTDFPYDVVLGVFAYPEAAAAARIASAFGRPLVVLVMGSDINALARRGTLRPQITATLQAAHRVIAVSHALKEGVVALGIPSDHVIVQHNGVDGSRFTLMDRAEARRRLKISATRVIGFVGNLAHEKGADVLVSALGQLKERGHTGLHAVIVGQGPRRDELVAQTEQFGEAIQVTFAGRQPPDEMPYWMSAFDLLCVPSRREGCPNVVLEALASGRPVVGTRVGGIPELLNTSNGLLVPPEDAPALAHAIEECLGRSWDAATLRQSVSSLSWDAIGRAIFDALASAVAAGASKTAIC